MHDAEDGGAAREPWAIHEEDLRSARRVVEAHAVRTPLVRWMGSGGAEGVFLKLENQQRTGSFKLRGALAALAALGERERAGGVVTASAGNHGYGLATAGRLLGVEVTVFCGPAAPEVKREGIRRAGAKLEVLESAGMDALEVHASDFARQRGVPYVSPYDDPHVAAGNGGTLAMEILEEMPDVATIVAPVGGGGLISGIAESRRLRGATFDLVGVQSEACPSMAESLRQDRAFLTYDGRPSVAEGLVGGVSESTFRIAKAALREMAVVSEASLVDAMAALAGEGIRVEGSAAPPLAWIQRGATPRTPCVLVISGGNVDVTA